MMVYSARHPWDADDPYPGEDHPGHDCDHLDYEADILTGVATCPECGHRWVQTRDEIKRERQAQIAYDKMIEDAEREHNSLRGRLGRLIGRVRLRFRRSRPDDEIPF